MTNISKNAFISIVGKPNVGKSSLLNALVGEKIAAVSSKPQTTRTKITGVITKDESQYVFMDTPGFHKAKTKLSAHMNKAVSNSIGDGEVVLLIVDCTRKISENERNLAENLSKANSKLVLVINKIDLISNKEELMSVITSYSTLCDFDEVIPISVINNDGLELIMSTIDKYAVEGPHFFPDDTLTDQPEKVIMAEFIREKALNNLNEEIPHGIAVAIEELKERENRNGEAIMDVTATIFCERESHKGMVIGKNGSMLKKIASEARVELEEFFQIKVNLQCWVKVKEGWRNREGLIKNFGLSVK
ncbi:MAG: GTPase Era [Clostridiales bacterium]|nr:GTPase Era [Clostridiales bacterium]